MTICNSWKDYDEEQYQEVKQKILDGKRVDIKYVSIVMREKLYKEIPNIEMEDVGIKYTDDGNVISTGYLCLRKKTNRYINASYKARKNHEMNVLDMFVTSLVWIIAFIVAVLKMWS